MSAKDDDSVKNRSEAPGEDLGPSGPAYLSKLKSSSDVTDTREGPVEPAFLKSSSLPSPLNVFCSHTPGSSDLRKCYLSASSLIDGAKTVNEPELPGVRRCASRPLVKDSDKDDYPWQRTVTNDFLSAALGWKSNTLTNQLPVGFPLGVAKGNTMHLLEPQAHELSHVPCDSSLVRSLRQPMIPGYPFDLRASDTGATSGGLVVGSHWGKQVSDTTIRGDIHLSGLQDESTALGPKFSYPAAAPQAGIRTDTFSGNFISSIVDDPVDGSRPWMQQPACAVDADPSTLQHLGTVDNLDFDRFNTREIASVLDSGIFASDILGNAAVGGYSTQPGPVLERSGSSTTECVSPRSEEFQRAHTLTAMPPSRNMFTAMADKKASRLDSLPSYTVLDGPGPSGGFDSLDGLATDFLSGVSQEFTFAHFKTASADFETPNTLKPPVNERKLEPILGDQQDGTPGRNALAIEDFTPEIAALVPVDGEGNKLSYGSIQHNNGTCKPCVFYHNPNKKCLNGMLCLFCHFPHMPKKRVRVARKKRSATAGSLQHPVEASPNAGSVNTQENRAFGDLPCSISDQTIKTGGTLFPTVFSSNLATSPVANMVNYAAAHQFGDNLPPPGENSRRNAMLNLIMNGSGVDGGHFSQGPFWNPSDVPSGPPTSFFKTGIPDQFNVYDALAKATAASNPLFQSQCAQLSSLSRQSGQRRPTEYVHPEGYQNCGAVNRWRL